jgi:hypothetical protein
MYNYLELLDKIKNMIKIRLKKEKNDTGSEDR